MKKVVLALAVVCGLASCETPHIPELRNDVAVMDSHKEYLVTSMVIESDGIPTDITAKNDSITLEFGEYEQNELLIKYYEFFPEGPRVDKNNSYTMGFTGTQLDNITRNETKITYKVNLFQTQGDQLFMEVEAVSHPLYTPDYQVITFVMEKI